MIPQVTRVQLSQGAKAVARSVALVKSSAASGRRPTRNGCPRPGAAAGESAALLTWRTSIPLSLAVTTKPLFRADSCLRTASARVLAVDEHGIELDWPRRHALMRLHTALHVMSCVVVAPVTGGNTAMAKARLDFDVDMSVLDAAHSERETNAPTARGVETEAVWIGDGELDARPELVNTMSVKPPRGAGWRRRLSVPGIDLQPCGGTQARNIAEIGSIRVLRVRSEGRRNRRVKIALSDGPTA